MPRLRGKLLNLGEQLIGHFPRAATKFINKLQIFRAFLLGTSGSDYAEELILQKLNAEKFKKALQEEGIEIGIDFSVKLLSTESWPLTKVLRNYHYFRNSAEK